MTTMKAVDRPSASDDWAPRHAAAPVRAQIRGHVVCLGLIALLVPLTRWWAVQVLLVPLLIIAPLSAITEKRAGRTVACVVIDPSATARSEFRSLPSQTFVGTFRTNVRWCIDAGLPAPKPPASDPAPVAGFSFLHHGASPCSRYDSAYPISVVCLDRQPVRACP